MMKKCGILLIVIILSLGVLFPLRNVYAGDSFFEVKERDVLKNEDVYLIINLDKIDYDNFKFELVADAELSNIESNENVNIQQEDNELYMEIDKSNVDISKLELIYKVPENKDVGEKIVFVASVTDLSEGNTNETKTEQVEVIIVENKKDVNNGGNLNDNRENSNNKENGVE